MSKKNSDATRKKLVSLLVFIQNVKNLGCENVCFNQFAPISNVRLWGLQLLGCCIPACLYLVYVLNLVSRAQNEDRERKNAMKIQKVF